MANLREIKNRVMSTKNTAKVTRAMQMVSAAKSKIASKEALSIAEFTNKIKEIINKLGITETKRKSESNKIAVVVIGPSRGFVGQLNNMLISKLVEFKKEKINFSVEGIGVCKHGAKIILQSGLPLKYNFENENDTSSILTLIQDNFNNDIYREFYLVYSKFINLLKSEAIIEKILPGENENNDRSDDSFLYEPNQEEVKQNLLEKLFEAKLLSSILNSRASEHASRMITMKNATDNAMDLVGTLTQTLNKERQNKITQSIIEVASGGKNYEN